MYDVIIIGGGPAGLSAGIYALRGQLKTVLLEKMIPGGQVLTTYEVENYPGFTEKILGSVLMQNMEEQAKGFGLDIRLEEVINVDLEGEVKKITTREQAYESKTVIIASGAAPQPLNVKGEKEFTGKGVSYCATCDGFFFKNKEVAIVGGGNTALEEALYLARVASKVTVIHRRDQLRAAKILQERAFENEKINFMWDSVIDSLAGETKLNNIKVKNVKTNEITQLNIDGLFISIGLLPNSDIFTNKLEIEGGFIKTDEDMKTSVAGVFAAGDIRVKPVKQIVTAASDGAISAVSAEKYIENI